MKRIKHSVEKPLQNSKRAHFEIFINIFSTNIISERFVPKEFLERFKTLL